MNITVREDPLRSEAEICVTVLCGMRPFTWTFCAWTAGGIAGASALAFGIADRIEAHVLAKINEKLGQNE